LGKPVIYPRGANIGLQRRYEFVGANGDVLGQIAGDAVTAEFAFSNLPQNIRDALLDIDAWTKQKALEQEDMV